MQPVNAKSLFSILCATIEKVDKGEIETNKAIAISKIAAQATNLLNYELKRAALMTSEQFKANHRNLEIKNFDCLPEPSHIIYAKHDE
jgi:hypothetical protein